jgi:hypothetical protein
LIDPAAQRNFIKAELLGKFEKTEDTRAKSAMGDKGFRAARVIGGQ